MKRAVFYCPRLDFTFIRIEGPDDLIYYEFKMEDKPLSKFIMTRTFNSRNYKIIYLGEL